MRIGLSFLILLSLPSMGQAPEAPRVDMFCKNGLLHLHVKVPDAKMIAAFTISVDEARCNRDAKDV